MARGGKNYIPRRDETLTPWADQFSAAVTEFYENQALDPRRLAPLLAALKDWRLAQTAHQRAQAAAESARQAKDRARALLETQIRPVAMFVQAFPATTDADRAAMGISIPTRRPARSAAPVAAPRVTIDAEARLRHTLRLVNPAALTPPPRFGPGAREETTRAGRPRSAARAEVFYTLTHADDPAPTSADGFMFAGLSTSDRLAVSFMASDARRVAHYLARWVNGRGEPGPWSPVASATVAA
jgi:hypothetical protein